MYLFEAMRVDKKHAKEEKGREMNIKKKKIRDVYMFDTIKRKSL